MFGERTSTREDGDSIVALIKETADGFGRLIADHLRLARLEVVADIKTHGRDVAAVALIVPFLFLGYALACLGLALVLGRWMGLPVALFVVGGVHLVAGAAGLAVVLGKLRRAEILSESSHEVDRSVAALAARVTNGTGGA
jgi:hypothetical protein